MRDPKCKIPKFEIPNPNQRKVETKQARLRYSVNETAPANDSKLGSGVCANVLIDHAGNSGLRRGADNPFLVASVLKKNQRRDAFDAESLRHRRVVIDIQLHYPGAAGVLFGDCFDGRREHAARRAPGGPKINQHRLIGIQHIILEIAVAHFSDVIAHEKLLVLFGSVLILRTTVGRESVRKALDTSWLRPTTNYQWSYR